MYDEDEQGEGEVVEGGKRKADEEACGVGGEQDGDSEDDDEEEAAGRGRAAGILLAEKITATGGNRQLGGFSLLSALTQPRTSGEVMREE